MTGRLPLTFEECRARFRRSVRRCGLTVNTHEIAARGPEGQLLSIDSTSAGAAAPKRLLIVLSGVHGVEGFIGSALQCDLLERLDPASLPADVGLLVVHAVNPWGMSWWRRQNESNVDLNRNWRRSEFDPQHNDAYDQIHPLACPDTATMPDVDQLMVDALAMVEANGLNWVRDGITRGQYRHHDGLHFGGDRTEESNRIVQALVAQRIGAAEKVLTIDLHTGHGPFNEITLLSDAPPGSDQDRFFAERFPGERVEATTDNPDATTGPKSGQIANGVRGLAPDATWMSTSVEFGTARDEEQLVATYHEQWVHRRGDRTIPEHADAIWAYRCCFTPDDRG